MNAPHLPVISVVIVTYNSAAFLRETIEALLAQDYPDFEPILVDNASRDDSLAIAREYELRGLRIMPNVVNRGFSGGNNDGVAASRGELVLLLNPDAKLEPNGLREIARAFAADSRAGIVGAKLIDPDGVTLQHCGGIVGLPAHCTLIGRGEPDTGQHDTPGHVEFVIGAALAIRRTLWDQLGGLDDDFNPAYYEDTDLCARVRHAGFAVLYWPPLRLIHHENVSTEYMSPAFWRMMQTNRLRYTFKHHTLAQLLFKAFPAEWRWFWMKDLKYQRRSMLRLYGRALRRMLFGRCCVQHPPKAKSE